MATKVFWYTSVIDGRTPWVAHGRYQFDFHRLRRHVNLLDRRGFYGSLFGTYGHDIWTLASALISETQVHRFLLPIYPGLDSPTALAQRASTFDDITGGRLIFNVVNGTDSSSAAYGIRIPRDERYELSLEYWSLFKKVYQGQPITEPGRYFDLSPSGTTPLPPSLLTAGQIQKPHTPLWGAGNSDAGNVHAGKLFDRHLIFWDRHERLKPKVERSRAAAAAAGRKVPIGLHASVIVRDTDEQAWVEAQRIFDAGGADALREFTNGNAYRYGIAGGFDELTSDDPELRRRIEILRTTKRPIAKDFETSPGLWAGVTQFAPPDVLGNGLGLYLVGSPRTVADLIREYTEEYDADAIILSSWPLTAEADRFADQVLPLLDLDDPREGISLALRQTARDPQGPGETSQFVATTGWGD